MPFEDLDQLARQVVEARAAIRQERNSDPLTPIIGDAGTQGGRLLLQDQKAAEQHRAFWEIASGGIATP